MKSFKEILQEKISKAVPQFNKTWETMKLDYSKLYVNFEFECILKSAGKGRNKDYDTYARAIKNIFGNPEVDFEPVRKNKNNWSIEEDESVVSRTGKRAVEIVSPWISGEQAEDVLNKFRTIFINFNGITDASCGGHINIRFKEDTELDILKMIVLSQEKEDLYKFGRSNNKYASSVMDKIKEMIKDKYLFGNANERFNNFYTMEKYDSINLLKAFNDFEGYKLGFFEFRGPGNNYLGRYYNLFVKTLRKYMSLLIVAGTDVFDNEYKVRLSRLQNMIPDDYSEIKQLVLRKEYQKIRENYTFTSLMYNGWYDTGNKIIDLKRVADRSIIHNGNLTFSTRKTVTELPIGFKKIKEVTGVLDISNNNLKTLTNCPEKVFDFKCDNNKELTSLVGSPKIVLGYAEYSWLGISDLKGCASDIKGNFICARNKNLISLEGMPNMLNGDFRCFHNPLLVDLEGMSKIVNGNFYCNDNKQLKSLIGAPKIVKTFSCINNESLRTLEGGPEIVKGDLVLKNIQLENLNGFPKVVKGNVLFYSGGDKFTEKDIRDVCDVLYDVIIY